MADSEAFEVFQDADGRSYLRVVAASGSLGTWMALAAGRQMSMAEVIAGLRLWHPSAVIRDVVTGPPAGDDAILWLA